MNNNIVHQGTGPLWEGESYIYLRLSDVIIINNNNIIIIIIFVIIIIILSIYRALIY